MIGIRYQAGHIAVAAILGFIVGSGFVIVCLLTNGHKRAPVPLAGTVSPSTQNGGHIEVPVADEINSTKLSMSLGEAFPHADMLHVLPVQINHFVNGMTYQVLGYVTEDGTPVKTKEAGTIAVSQEPNGELVYSTSRDIMHMEPDTYFKAHRENGGWRFEKLEPKDVSHKIHDYDWIYSSGP